MTRRAFLPAAASTFAAANAAAADAPRSVILELRRIQLRNSPDDQRQRNHDFLKQHVAAFERSGAAPIGVFSSTIASDGPFLLVLSGYPSLSALEQVQSTLAADTAYQKALDAYNALPGLNYQRMEISLLRAFDGYPNITPPPNDGKRPARLFELRQYESNNSATLKRKIKMFNDGEIGAFQRAGAQPVFFAETIVGPRLPNLTYMLSYQDLAARDKVWKAFSADPQWQKLRTTPGLSDAEIVSGITNYLVSPLPFSPIK
jgi:hypothetical protein